MLRFEQVSKGYAGGFVALDRVSFELEKGDDELTQDYSL